MINEYPRSVRLDIIPIAVGFIGGAFLFSSLFSSVPIPPIPLWYQWSLCLTCGLIGGLVGLRIALIDLWEREEWLKMLIEDRKHLQRLIDEQH